MRRIPAALLTLTLFASLPLFAGCGDDEKVGQVTQSPESKNADEAGRKAMEDMMKGKGKK